MSLLECEDAILSREKEADFAAKILSREIQKNGSLKLHREYDFDFQLLSSIARKIRIQNEFDLVIERNQKEKAEKSQARYKKLSFIPIAILMIGFFLKPPEFVQKKLEKFEKVSMAIKIVKRALAKTNMGYALQIEFPGRVFIANGKELKWDPELTGVRLVEDEVQDKKAMEANASDLVQMVKKSQAMSKGVDSNDVNLFSLNLGAANKDDPQLYASEKARAFIKKDENDFFSKMIGKVGSVDNVNNLPPSSFFLGAKSAGASERNNDLSSTKALMEGKAESVEIKTKLYARLEPSQENEVNGWKKVINAVAREDTIASDKKGNYFSPVNGASANLTEQQLLKQASVLKKY